MPLISGARIASYEVVELLGAGGMGEVYRARDTKLKRDIALKVLPEAVARDVDRLARFQREAERLAALNHTNIAAVYGLEESGAVTAIILELVEGPLTPFAVVSAAGARLQAVPTSRASVLAWVVAAVAILVALALAAVILRHREPADPATVRLLMESRKSEV